MRDFEDIMEEIVGTLQPVEIYTDEAVPANSISKDIKFYWGRTEQDLLMFIRTHGEQTDPLIFSITKPDTELDEGSRYRRDAELLLCTRNTNRDELNTVRLADEKSYKKVLFPMWDGLYRSIQVSANMNIESDTIVREKFPDYKLGGERSNPVIWDVFKVKFRANFNENYNC